MTRQQPQPARRTARPAGFGRGIGLAALLLALLANDLAMFLSPETLRAGPSPAFQSLLAAAATLLPVGVLWCVCNILWGNGFGDAGLVRGGVLGLKRLGGAALVCAALYLLW